MGALGGTIDTVTVKGGNLVAVVGAALLRVRWVVRAPILLYRARLGVVFRGRLLMLEHTGRNSGRVRYVVLEIINRPAPNRYVVVSGFGVGAQWFRNVEANPQVHVRLGSGKSACAVSHRLDSKDAGASLGRYAKAHPYAWAKLRAILEQTLGTTIGEHGTDLAMIALDVATSGNAGTDPTGD